MFNFVRGTHVPEEDKSYILFPNGKRLGFTCGSIAVISEDVFKQFDGIALSLHVWAALNNGAVEIVECLSQGTSFSLVPKGLLQYTFTIEDANRYGREQWHPWCKDLRWVIPSSVLTVIKPKEVA